MKTHGGRVGLLLALLGTAVLLGGATVGHAHEPVFSLGPHTLYEGGIGLVGTYDARAAGGGIDQTPRLGLTYGITPHLQIGASVPYRITPRDHGVGDAAAALRWRFWRDYGKGWLHSAAVQGLLKLPSGQQKPGISTGDAAYGVALTWGYESLRWYAFGTAQYTTFDAGLVDKPGDLARGALVGGARLWIPEYEDPDLVLLVELLGGWRGATVTEDGHEETGTPVGGAALAPAPGRLVPAHSGGVESPVLGAGTGGERAFLRWAPEALLSWRNVMLKAGVVLPIWAADALGEPDWRIKTSLIVQL